MCHWLSVCVNCVSDIALCYHIDRFINNTVTDGLRCHVYKQPVGSQRCEWLLAAASTHIYQASSTVITHSANDAPVCNSLSHTGQLASVTALPSNKELLSSCHHHQKGSKSLPPWKLFPSASSFWDQLSPYLLLEPVEQT